VKRALKVLAFIGALFAFAFAALVWFGIGEHERLFGEPVNLVFPKGFNGLVCVQFSPGPPPIYERPKHYNVSPEGLVLIPSAVLQSLNPRNYFERDATSGALRLMPSDYYLGIFSENAPSGVAYTVGWVGSTASWDAFRKSRANQQYCLGRHAPGTWTQ
jgi:hypothetical protein